MMNGKQKLYCYVDETGQDTKGKLFIVSVVVAKADRNELNNFLKKIEIETGKKKVKWTRTKREYKITYLEAVLSSKSFRNKIFYSLGEQESKAYKEITLVTIASAITSAKDTENYKASIFIDGLPKAEVKTVSVRLRKIGVRTEKVVGVKDENEPLIRLADAISGLVREDFEKVDYAQKLFKLASSKKVLTKV